MKIEVPSLSTSTSSPSDPRRWLMLTILLGATFMATLDSFIVNVAIPSIENQLHASFAEVQLIVAGYTLALAVLLVTAGRLGDIYGRKRVFLIGIGGFTLFSALCGLAPNALFLIIFRVAKGASAALMMPQVISFIQVSFSLKERPRAFGGNAAAAGLASILGQVFGGFLLGINLFDLGWRSIFLVNVPIGIIALFAAIPLIQESRLQSEERRLDYGGVALLTLTLFLLVFPLVLGGNEGWPLWAQICLLLVIPSLVAFLAYEQRMTKRGNTPLISLNLFRQWRFPAGLITITLAVALAATVIFLLAFYLQTVLHLTPLLAGLVFMPSSIGFALAAGLNSVLATRLGKFVLPFAAILIILSDLLILLAAQFFVPLWGLVPLLVALFFSGSGMGLMGTQLMHKTLEEITHDDVGTASGVYTTVSQVAGAFGVALIGLLFATVATSSGSTLQAFVVSLLVITLCSIGLLLTSLPLNKPSLLYERSVDLSRE